MTEHIDQTAPHDAGEHHDDGHHDVNYAKIYVALLVLLVISILGPELGITWVTLITAFGIALVKATMVINNFMHLKWEKNFIKWALVVSLLFVALFFFGVAPDVMKHDGLRWVNDAAIASVERGIEPPHGEEGEHAAEDGEGEDHAEEGDDTTVEGEGEGATETVAAAFSAPDAYSATCATCHGPNGGGDGPGAAALDPQPASFATTEFWDEVTRESMVNVIQNGGAAEGLSAAMPAWGALYSDDEIQQIVDYVETFQP